MYYILIPENLRSQNSIILEHLCRVHKIKHTATRIFTVCFIQAHDKRCRRSKWRHWTPSLPCVISQAHGKGVKFTVCILFAVGQDIWHMANGAFAVCPIVRPRQTFWHKANARFSGSEIQFNYSWYASDSFAAFLYFQRCSLYKHASFQFSVLQIKCMRIL